MPDADVSVQPKKILLVDDEPINIQVLHRSFAQDYQVFMATSGQQAISAAIKQQPDIILLDVSMPGMDGFETCERLKSDLGTRGIPVIFVTAHNDLVREARGLDVGAVDFISKPIDPNLVRARVARHIGLKRQSDRLRQRVFMDAETGAFNRAYFDSRFATEWRKAYREQASLSLMLMSMQETAALALPEQMRLLATHMQARFQRPGDVLARYDGTTLACLLPHADMASSQQLAESLLASLSEADQGLLNIGLGVAAPTELNHQDQLLALTGDQLSLAKTADRASVRAGGLA
jgi:PleD family two-component response regulator